MTIKRIQRHGEIGYRNEGDEVADRDRAWMMEKYEAGQFGKRLQGFGNTFQKANRIIANQSNTFVILDNEPKLTAPGWTDGITVTINAKMLHEALGNDIKGWVRQAKAINLHELSHVLYTPRKGSALYKWLLQNMGYFKSFNILEDQRIEMMFTAKYRPAGAYFESMILQWFLNSKRQYDSAHALLYGRRYLPTELTAPIRARFVEKNGIEITTKLESVIDEYLTCIFPQDYDKAQRLIREYKAIMDKAFYTPDQPFDDDIEGLAKGKVAKKGEQVDAQEQMDQVQPRELGDSTESDSEAQGEGEGEGEEEGSEATGGAGGDEGDQEAQQGENGAEGDSEGDSGVPEDIAQDGAGKGRAEQEVLDDKGLEDIAKNVQRDLYDNEQFNQDIENAAKNIQDAIANEEMDVQGTKAKHSHRSVRPELTNASKAMQRELANMKVLLEPEYMRKQMNGKLDARKFLARQPWEVDFFTAYNPGALEDTDIEAVILIDMSGSMAGRMNSACEAMWATSRALESLDARVTCIGFGDRHYVLQEPDQKVEADRLPIFFTQGGTDPTGALGQAYSILQGSRRSIKLLLTVTDGQWYCDLNRTDTIVRAINASGVTSSLMYLGHYADQAAENQHEHNLFSVIDSMKALPETAVEIVEHAMAEHIVMA